MYWKLFIISLLIIPLITIPSAEANIFTDFWDLLFGKDEVSRFKIIDDRTELNCTGLNCIWTSYLGKKFTEYNEEFYTYDNFTIIAREESNLDIRYKYLDDVEINLTPVIESAGVKTNLRDLSDRTKTDLNYVTTINNYRDFSKYTIEINKLVDTDRIGLQVQSNRKISYVDFNYTKIGVYNLSENESVPSFPVTDLIIEDRRFSFIDLVEADFTTSYDKRNDILWIDIRDKSGRIILDPESSFHSESNDGQWNMEEPSGICSGVSNLNNTLAIIQDNHQISPATFSELGFTFNTSTIVDNASVHNATTMFFAQSYQVKGPPITYDVIYLSKPSTLSEPLVCADRGGFINDGGLDWNKITGYVNKSMNVTQVNITGNTSYRLADGWQHLASTRSASITIRMSDFAGNTSDPTLVINYTEIPPIPPTPEVANVTLIDPPDMASFSTNPINFTYNATNFSINIDFCTLLVGDQTFRDFSITEDINQTFLETINVGTHIWNVSCSTDAIVNDSFVSQYLVNRTLTDLIDTISVSQRNDSWINGTGITSRINLGDVVDYEFTNDNFTISLWFNTSGNNEANLTGTFISKYHALGNQREWRVEINQSGQPFFYTNPDGAGSHEVIRVPDDVSYNDARWYHLVAMLNGTTKFIYIDGVQLVNGTSTGLFAGTAAVMIGASARSSTAPDLFYNGSMDDIRIYNRTLREDEILSLNSSGRILNMSLVNQTLIGHWAFNEGMGATEFDLSNRSHDGTLESGMAFDNDKIDFSLVQDTDYTLNGIIFNLTNTNLQRALTVFNYLIIGNTTNSTDNFEITISAAGVCTDNYVSGQWDIFGEVNCTSENFSVSGNINFSQDGRLNIHHSNVSIDLNAFRILVRDGARLLLNRSSRLGGGF